MAECQQTIFPALLFSNIFVTKIFKIFYFVTECLGFYALWNLKTKKKNRKVFSLSAFQKCLHIRRRVRLIFIFVIHLNQKKNGILIYVLQCEASVCNSKQNTFHYYHLRLSDQPFFYILEVAGFDCTLIAVLVAVRLYMFGTDCTH